MQSPWKIAAIAAIAATIIMAFFQSAFAGKELPPRQKIILDKEFRMNSLTRQFGEDLMLRQLEARSRIFTAAIEKHDWDLLWELSTQGFREDSVAINDPRLPEAKRKALYTKSLDIFLEKVCTRFFPAPTIRISVSGLETNERPYAVIEYFHDIQHPAQSDAWKMRMEVQWVWTQWEDKPWQWYWHGTVSHKEVSTTEKIYPCK